MVKIQSCHLFPIIFLNMRIFVKNLFWFSGINKTGMKLKNIAYLVIFFSEQDFPNAKIIDNE